MLGSMDIEAVLPIFRLVRLAVQAYQGLIIASVLLSWFTLGGSGHPSIYRAQEFLHRVTDPFMAPIRQVLMPLTMRIGLDVSPIIALFFLSFIINWLPG